MALLLVPNEATTDRATLWVGAIDEPAIAPERLSVAVSGSASVPLGSWDGEVRGGDRSIVYRRLDIRGLRPASRVPVQLRLDGRTVPGADAVLATLPVRVPTLGERPFTILLGSCFARSKDGSGSTGQAFSLLPAGARPDLKILCGDQVYLDAEAETFAPSSGEDDLRRRQLRLYVNAWTQSPGFLDLLRDGPNLFGSDDHDFWNNAPNPSIVAPETFLPGGSERWMAIATQLFVAFQRPVEPLIRPLDIEGLSIYLADTRIHRGNKTGAFMSEADLASVEAWAAGLRSPGCLVLGQLPFEKKAGWKGRFLDWGLADYAQYPRLVRAMTDAPHSVVVLTGDVHFGRVAVSQVNPGREVIEVVASPFALIAKTGGGWHDAPDRFPAEAIPGHVRRPVSTSSGYRTAANHFATLEFSRSGAFTHLRVRAWPVETKGLPPVPSHSFEHRLA